MDGDRPVADGRDIFESKLQAIVRDAFATGYLQGYGRRGFRSVSCELYCQQIKEVLISYFDEPSSDVSAQDEKETFRYSFKEFDDILPSTKPQVDEAF